MLAIFSIDPTASARGLKPSIRISRGDPSFDLHQRLPGQGEELARSGLPWGEQKRAGHAGHLHPPIEAQSATRSRIEEPHHERNFEPQGLGGSGDDLHSHAHKCLGRQIVVGEGIQLINPRSEVPRALSRAMSWMVIDSSLASESFLLLTPGS
jgi:hypothetical protein